MAGYAVRQCWKRERGPEEQSMLGLALPNGTGRRFGWLVVVAAASLLGAAGLRTPARAGEDLFQKAVNYVFTGQVDPREAPEIVDRKSCVIVMRDPKFNRYIRYYLLRFKMDDALFDKNYSGSRVSYRLSVKGDDILIEYLDPDRRTVMQGYRSAQIPLPGEIEQTQKALQIIFTDHCKAEKQKSPF
jgi:hypothetical protein